MIYRKENNWFIKQYHKLCDTVNAIILCIKYPFLYPRDYDNGKHKSIWKLDKFLIKEYKKAFNINDKRVNINSKELPNEIHSYFHFWIYTITTFYYDYIIQFLFCIPTETLLDDMQTGWRK